MGASGIKYMQSFQNDIPDVRTMNFEQRGIDRIFTNEMILSDWQMLAKELQQSLTDEVIETSVRQLPPEIFSISGNDIISKLKSRREHLLEYATQYYLFLAKEVDVPGTEEREHFKITRSTNDETSVNIYSVNKEGKENDSAFYSRTFNANETKEIRVYGLSGNDQYTIDGNANHAIKLRIIGGDKKDEIINHSNISAGGKNLHVYDNADNTFQSPKGTKLHISDDTSVHKFNYKWYRYDKGGIKPLIFYNYLDRLYVGLGYSAIKSKWRREPFASKQSVEAHYSISQKAFSGLYNGVFPKLLGKWDLLLNAYYDAVIWTNFYGLGNETKLLKKDVDFNRTRTKEWLGIFGIRRRWSKNDFAVSANYRSAQVLNDEQRFVAKTLRPANPDVFNTNSFGGARLDYSLHQLNDTVVPTRGFIFSANASYNHNFRQTSKSFSKFGSEFQFYLPLGSSLSLASKTGASTVAGTPEFYQYAYIGGIEHLRGFRRERFWGKTAFYNSNELRLIGNIRSYLFNGQAGIFGFFDDGRVCIPIYSILIIT